MWLRSRAYGSGGKKVQTRDKETAGLSTTLRSGRDDNSSLYKQICHLDRTRISCHAALDMAACAAFVKESRMKCANAIKFHRKSGEA
jgi:hypothetical protein